MNRWQDGAWKPLGTWPTSRPRRPGDIEALAFAGWRVLQVGGMPAADGRRRVLLGRIWGREHPAENASGHIVLLEPPPSWRERWHQYPMAAMPLSSCCAQPYPCVCEVAAELAAAELPTLELALACAVEPARCAACGEQLTVNEPGQRMPGAHLDLPVDHGPSFHDRDTCAAARNDYAMRLFDRDRPGWRSS